MATSYKIENHRITIEGKKFHTNGNPVIGVYIQLLRADTQEIIGYTTTDEDGYWSITKDESEIPSGRYHIKFIGSGMIQAMTPNGDWEWIDIMGDDMLDPIQPADIQGLLRETITIIDDSTVLVEYAVAINATRVSISNVGTATVSGLEITLIQQHKNPIITTPDFDTAYNLTDWNATPADPCNLAVGETIIYDLTTSLISAAYKVKIIGAHVGNSNLKIKITSRLAADEIDAGRIRVEKGISISDGGASGFIIDTASIRGIDELGQTVVALYNDGQTVGTLTDIYAKIGGWAITETSLVREVSGSKIEVVGTNTPYIGVGNGVTEYARMGYLSSDVNGIWATVGGFGGTSYDNAKVFINSSGLYINDDYSAPITYITGDTDWRSIDTTVVENATFASSAEGWDVTNGFSWITNYIKATAGSGKSTYKSLGAGVANKTYTLRIEHNCANAPSDITIRIAHSGSYTDYTVTVPPYTNSTWQKTFTTTTNGIITVTISGTVVYEYYLSTVRLEYSSSFSELSAAGLFLVNNANSYIKFGKGIAEIKGSGFEVEDLTIYGNFNQYGTWHQYGSVVISAPIQVLNYNAALPSYGGIEVDNTSGDNQLLTYSSGDSAWIVAKRTGTGAGGQTGITKNGVILHGGASFNYETDATYDIGSINTGRPRDVHIGRDIYIAGNIYLTGDIDEVDISVLKVADKQISMAVSTNPTDALADGGGIILKGTTDKTILWDLSNTNWTSTEHWNLASGKTYKINNVSVVEGANPVLSSSSPTFVALTLGTSVKLPTLFTTTKHYTGFPNRADTALSFNNTNRRMTITGTNFKVYLNGSEYTLNTSYVTITDSTNFYWIYYSLVDNVPTLTASSSYPGFDQCLVAGVYWNSTTGVGILSDERHWMGRDQWTHEYLHETVGTRYASGLAGTFGNSSITIAAGEIYDEDIEHEITQQTSCMVLYHDGSSAYKSIAGSAVPYYEVSSNIQYNNSTTLTAVPANNYVAYWVFASNNTSYPIMVLMGQRVDANIANARANNVPENLIYDTLPVAEMKLLYRIIYRNTGSPPTYIEAADYRAVTPLPTSNYIATDHHALSNLTTGDDHTQYLYLAGRGGQTISDALTLSSTLTLPNSNTLTGSSGLVEFSAGASLTGNLYVKGGNLYTDTGVNLNIAPGGDIILDPTGNDILPASNYDLNLGSLSKKYLTLHAAELIVETLVAQDTLATIGGRVLVGPTTVLTSDLAASESATTIYTKHNNLVVGDIVYLEANAVIEFMKIESGPSGVGPYTYVVDRNIEEHAAHAWYAGDAIFNTGVTGDGFIDLYSLRSVKSAAQYGPTIVGNVRDNDVTYNAWTEHWAIGNLNGIYGYSSNVYGFAAGKYANSYSFVTVDSTNGVRLLYRSGGNDYTRISLATNGSGYLASSNIAWTSAGVITVGGWTINANTIENISSGTGVIMSVADSHPYVMAEYSSSEKARLGYLTTNTYGLWGTVGGFGGTSYATAKVLIDSYGLYINDINSIPITYMTGNTSWRSITSSGLDTTDFESSANGWSTSTGFARSTSKAHTGTYSFLGTGASERDWMCWTSKNLGAAVPGHSTSITLWYWPMEGTVGVYANYDDTEHELLNYDSGQGGLYDWSEFVATFTPQTDSDITITISGNNQVGLYIDDIEIKSTTPFSELNAKGLYVVNSESQYLKFGSGVAELKGFTAEIDSLTVYNSFISYGTWTNYGTVIIANPFQVVNNDAAIPNYAGFEIDSGTGGTNRLIYWDTTNTKWALGTRAHVAKGSQTAPTLGANFSIGTGSFTVGAIMSSGKLTVTTSTSPGIEIVKDNSVDNRYLRFTASNTDGKQVDIINSGTSTSSLIGFYNHSNSYWLSYWDITTGNFSNLGTIQGSVLITQNASNPYVYFNKTGSTARSAYIEITGDTFRLYYEGAAALSFDTSRNATFASTINSGAITSSGNITIDKVPINISYPTPGLTSQCGLHFEPTNDVSYYDYSQGITWGIPNPSYADKTHAGIYVQSSGTYGSKMYFATSNNWAVGAIAHMQINHYGEVSISKQGVFANAGYSSLSIFDTTEGSSANRLVDITNGVDMNFNIYITNAGKTFKYAELASYSTLPLILNATSGGSIILGGNLATDYNSKLQIYQNWFDTSSNPEGWGGGIKLVGDAPTLAFCETDQSNVGWMWHVSGDKMNLYRRAVGGSWQRPFYVHESMRAYFTSIVSTDDWFYVTTNKTGLYNEVQTTHWYCDGLNFWNISSGGSPTSGGIRMRTNHDSTIKGYLYWDSSGIGLLNDQSGWSVRCNQGSGYGGYLFGSWITIGDLRTSGVLLHQSNIRVLNKAESDWVTWATRNTSGSETVIDLSNIGSIEFVSGTPSLSKRFSGSQVFSYTEDSQIRKVLQFTNPDTGYKSGVLFGTVTLVFSGMETGNANPVFLVRRYTVRVRDWYAGGEYNMTAYIASDYEEGVSNSITLDVDTASSSTLVMKVKVYQNNGLFDSGSKLTVSYDFTSTAVHLGNFITPSFADGTTTTGNPSSQGAVVLASSIGSVVVGGNDPTINGYYTSRFTIVAGSQSTGLGVAYNSSTPAFALNPLSNSAWTLYDWYGSSWHAGITQRNGYIGVETATPFTSITLPSATDGKYVAWDYKSGASDSRRWWLGNDQYAYGDFAIRTESSQGLSAPDLVRLLIDKNGFVGIPVIGNGRLSVRGTGTSSSTYSFEASNSSGSTRFLVRDDGWSAFYGSDDALTLTLGADHVATFANAVISNGMYNSTTYTESWEAGSDPVWLKLFTFGGEYGYATVKGYISSTDNEQPFEIKVMTTYYTPDSYSPMLEIEHHSYNPRLLAVRLEGVNGGAKSVYVKLNPVTYGVNINWRLLNCFTVNPTINNSKTTPVGEYYVEHTSYGYSAHISNSSWMFKENIYLQPITNKYFVLNRPANTNYLGLSYRTNGAGEWFVGQRELSNSNLYIYNESGTNTVIFDKTTNAVTFANNITLTNGYITTNYDYYGLIVNITAAGSQTPFRIKRSDSVVWDVNLIETTNDLGFYSYGVGYALRLNKSTLGVGIGSTPLYITDSYFGYSGAYRVLQLGTCEATRAVAIGVNLTSYTSGQFQGNEIVIPNNICVIAPQSNTSAAFIGVLKRTDSYLYLGGDNYALANSITIDNSGNVVVPSNLTLSNGNVTIATGKGYMLGVGTNTYISRETSGGARFAVTVAGVEALRILESDDSATFAGNVIMANAKAIYSTTYSVSDPYTGYYLTQVGSVFGKLTVNEMHAKSFITDIEQALVGGQIICKSAAKLYQDFVCGTDTYLYVEEITGYTGQVFADGDYVRIKNISMGAFHLDITEAWLTVTYYDRDTTNKYQRYTYTKQSGTSTTYTKGTIALDYGVSGNGILERCALNEVGNRPYDRIATWTTAPQTDLITRSQIGDLSGVNTLTYGALASSTFGVYTRDLYAEGNANIVGTLAVGGGSTIGNTFYVGKIHTNLLTGVSDDCFYGRSGGGVGTDITGNVTAPDGSTVLYHKSDDATDLWYYLNLTGALSSGTYTTSVWVWTDTNGTVNSDIWGVFGTIYADTWTRLSVVRTSFTGYQSGMDWVLRHSGGATKKLAFWGLQVESGSITTVYQKTDGSNTGSGYGMWAIAGGFGGSIQNPTISLSSAGMRVLDAGTSTAIAAAGTYIGRYTVDGYQAVVINSSGISGYTGSGTTKNFYLPTSGTATISGFSFDANRMTLGSILQIGNYLSAGIGEANNSAGFGFWDNGSRPIFWLRGSSGVLMEMGVIGTITYLGFHDGSRWNLRLGSLKAFDSGSDVVGFELLNSSGTSIMRVDSGGTAHIANWGINQYAFYKNAGDSRTQSVALYQDAGGAALTIVNGAAYSTTSVARITVGRILTTAWGWSTKFGINAYDASGNELFFLTADATNTSHIAGWSFDPTVFAKDSLSDAVDEKYWQGTGVRLASKAGRFEDYAARDYTAGLTIGNHNGGSDTFKLFVGRVADVDPGGTWSGVSKWTATGNNVRYGIQFVQWNLGNLFEISCDKNDNSSSFRAHIAGWRFNNKALWHDHGQDYVYILSDATQFSGAYTKPSIIMRGGSSGPFICIGNVYRESSMRDEFGFTLAADYNTAPVFEMTTRQYQIAGWNFTDSALYKTSGDNYSTLYSIANSVASSLFMRNTSSKIGVNVGLLYYSSDWQNEFGFSLSPDYTSTPYVQFSKNLSTGVLTARIASWVIGSDALTYNDSNNVYLNLLANSTNPSMYVGKYINSQWMWAFVGRNYWGSTPDWKNGYGFCASWESEAYPVFAAAKTTGNVTMPWGTIGANNTYFYVGKGDGSVYIGYDTSNNVMRLVGSFTSTATITGGTISGGTISGGTLNVGGLYASSTGQGGDVSVTAENVTFLLNGSNTCLMVLYGGGDIISYSGTSQNANYCLYYIGIYAGPSFNKKGIGFGEGTGDPIDVWLYRDSAAVLKTAAAFQCGTVNGQTISSSASFTGTLAVASTINGQTISSSANFTGTITLPNTNVLTGNTNSLSISKGLHVGGTSDVADNNLLVDGNIYVGASDVYFEKYTATYNGLKIYTYNGLAMTIDPSANVTIANSLTAGAATLAGTLNITYNGNSSLIISRSGGSTLNIYSGGSSSHQWDIYTSGTGLRFSDNTGGGNVRIDGGVDIYGAITSSSTFTLPNTNVFTGNANSVSISKGLHVGGASDVADNNLLVDGNIYVGASDVYFEKYTATYNGLKIYTYNGLAMTIDPSANVTIANSLTAGAMTASGNISATTDSANTLISVNTSSISYYAGFKLVNSNGPHYWCINLDGNLTTLYFDYDNLGSGSQTKMKLGSDGQFTVPDVYSRTVSTRAVYVDSNGLLGTTSSSLRYKERITDLELDSTLIYKLRPISFNFKPEFHIVERQFGLLAEEVNSVIPQLVGYDNNGRPDYVAYEKLPVLLLNELQKHYIQIETQKDKIIRLEKRVLELELQLKG